MIAEASRAGIDTLAITDHDTFAGYDEAAPYAIQAGLELVCGIELSTKLHGRSVHLLGYFFETADLAEFRSWIRGMQLMRRDRNIRLVARLRELGLEITLEEAEARGRGMTGRPHFAQILLERGYVANFQQAFDDYLDESAKGYVYRHEPQFAEGVERIRDAGGIASLAHPVRIKADLQAAIPELCDVGLNAVEVYHSDHSREQTELYLSIAKRHHLLVTGGSDFHGATKPNLRLGTGYGDKPVVPDQLMEQLRTRALKT